MLLLVLLVSIEAAVDTKEDLVLEGVYEAAIDLPRIHFILKRELTGPSLSKTEDSELEYAFLDTGASGIVISRETAERMGVSLDAKAKFVDVGVGGEEYFSVSQPLYIGLKGIETQNQGKENTYQFFGPWRFQVKQVEAGILEEPLDIVGMPVMIGQIVVLNSAATNSLAYFAADIKKTNDPKIPEVDVKVSLRLKKFVNTKNPENIPPLPVLTGNLVIDGVTVRYKGKVSKGSWLFDTGATVSLISTKQARALGIMDENDKPLVAKAFSVTIGGVGNMAEMAGFEVDNLTVPALSGRNLVFKNARLGVRDIEYFDEDKGERAVIDGIFGSNFLCASAKMEGMLPSEVSETAFDNIVIDLQKGTLGFDVRSNPKPAIQRQERKELKSLN